MNFIDINAARRKAGGTKPVHQSTIYRLVRRGLLPRPIRIGGSSRWIEAEFDAALAALAVRQ
jgi:predicted DNA-binding transcriptional regulator AlpA